MDMYQLASREEEKRMEELITLGFYDIVDNYHQRSH